MAYKSGSTISVLLGNGNGGFQPIVNLTLPNGVDSVAIADMNHDGIPDIIAAGFGVDVLIGNGDGTFQTSVPFGIPGVNAVDIAIGDFNGDSNPDVAVIHSFGVDVETSQPFGMVSVLMNNGDGTYSSPRLMEKA